MKPKALILHCQTILSKYHEFSKDPGTRLTSKSSPESIRRASIANSTRQGSRNTFTTTKEDSSGADDGGGYYMPTPTSIKLSFSRPVVVDEEEILKKYLVDMKITDQQDIHFIQTVFYGCIRYQLILKIALDALYKSAGSTLLRNKYNLFAVLFYLSLCQIKEIGFHDYAKYMKCFDPKETFLVVSFIFDKEKLQQLLLPLWSRTFDQDFIQKTFLMPLEKFQFEAEELMHDLNSKIEDGMICKKSNKEPTEPQPFTLSIPKPRKFEEPEIKIPNTIKARVIPKGVYYGTGEKEALEKAKIQNRQKAQDVYEKAQKDQFEVVKRIPKDKMIKEEKNSQIISSLNKIPQKFKFKPPPVTNNEAAVSFKLTTAAILREDALVRKKKQEEEENVNDVMISLRDPSEIKVKLEEEKTKAETEKKLHQERRRVEIQLMHEEVFIAKEEKRKENREIVQEIKEEKETFKVITEQSKREEEEQKRKVIEEIHEIQESIIKAKQTILEDNAKKAADMVQEKKALLEKAMRDAEEERQRKADLIKEIRLLEKHVTPHVKQVDLSKTAKLGLLTEMSILELQERLLLANARHREYEENKRNFIIKQKQERLDMIASKLREIEGARTERKLVRLSSSSLNSPSASSSQQQIDEGSLSNNLSLPDLSKGNPALKELYKKLEAKKSARKAQQSSNAASYASSIESANHRLTKALTPSFAKGISKTPLHASNGKWDDLEEAEAKYEAQRRQLQKEEADLMNEIYEVKDLILI